MFNFKKVGYSLAEVLIAMAAMGVIAAITIPVLMDKVNLYQKQTDAAYKKNVTLIENATGTIIASRTDVSLMGVCSEAADGYEKNKCVRDLYGKYISFIKVCEKGNTGCFSGDVGNTYPTAVALDGTLYAFMDADSNCQQSGTYTEISFKGASRGRHDKQYTRGCWVIMVDLNGLKKPNEMNLDIVKIPVTK